MAPKRSAKRTFDESGLEDSATLPKQTKLSWGKREVPANLPTPAISSSPEREQDNTSSKAKNLAAQKAADRKTAAKKLPTANKVYKDALKEVDKVFNQLVKKYKPNPTGWSGITADDFAESMYAFHPKVKNLREESTSAAFNLLLDLGEHAYGDLEACCKAGGFGDSDEPYKAMDGMLVELITARNEAQVVSDDDHNSSDDGFVIKPSSGDIGGEEKAILDDLGGKHPNKQERGWLQRARRADLKAMFETRRQRRVSVEDWVGNALNDLAETRSRIEGYGLGDHFFRESIDLLSSIKGIEPPPMRYR